MNNFETLFANWVVKYRWWIITLSILCTISFAGGLRHLTYKNDKRVFFSKENPQLQAFKQFEDTYTRDENVGFAVAPKDGNVFTRRTLKMLEELTKACWKIPYSSRVDSIINFQHTQYLSYCTSFLQLSTLLRVYLLILLYHSQSFFLTHRLQLI